METCSDFDERANSAPNLHPTGRRFSDPRQHFEQCALAGSVRPDESDDLADRHFESHIAQGPEPVVPSRGSATSIEDRTDRVRAGTEGMRDQVPNGIALQLTLPNT